MSPMLQVPDMSCGHCKAAVESAVMKVKGVRSAEVDLAAKTVMVDLDEETGDPEEVVGAIESAGYPVAPTS